jgi:DNA-binding response OmpR family regulator
MVVDDSPVALEAAALALEEAGMAVVKVDTPIAVQLVVAREHPDLLLLDVNMASLSGEHVVKSLRASRTLAKTRVVLYSDLPEAQLADLARRCGADGYLQKTNHAPALVERVRQWLTG